MEPIRQASDPRTHRIHSTQFFMAAIIGFLLGLPMAGYGIWSYDRGKIWVSRQAGGYYAIPSQTEFRQELTKLAFFSAILCVGGAVALGTAIRHRRRENYYGEPEEASGPTVDLD